MFDPRTADAARLAAAEVTARAEIKRSFAAVRDRSHPNDPATRAWQDAIARWHLAVERVYPAAFRADVAALKQARRRDEATGGWVWSPAPPGSIETAIRFLEADLDCFRSGYVKERLIRHLVRQPLGDESLRRLRGVVLAALRRPPRREFRAWCRLAVRVGDDDLRTHVDGLAESGDPNTRRRAAWMRDALREGCVAGEPRERAQARR